MTRFHALLAAVLLTACTTAPAPTTDASTTLDAGHMDADTTTDASADASADAALEDQGHDAGPPPCVPAGAWCHVSGTTYGRCLSSQVCGIGPIGTPLECAPISDCHVVDVSRIPECVSLVGPDGVACDDGDATTYADTCDAGECIGVSCVSEPCVLREWTGTRCNATFQREGICDDGDPSTYDDHCVYPGTCEGYPCECSEGACCDGCHLRPVGTVCEPMRVIESTCSGVAGLCGGTTRVTERHAEVQCSGISSACDGAATELPASTSYQCGDGASCRDGVCEVCP